MHIQSSQMMTVTPQSIIQIFMILYFNLCFFCFSVVVAKLQQSLCLQRNLFGFDVQSTQKQMTHYQFEGKVSKFLEWGSLFSKDKPFLCVREEKISKKTATFLYPLFCCGGFRDTKLFCFFLADIIVKNSPGWGQCIAGITACHIFPLCTTREGIKFITFLSHWVECQIPDKVFLKSARAKKVMDNGLVVNCHARGKYWPAVKVPKGKREAVA